MEIIVQLSMPFIPQHTMCFFASLGLYLPSLLAQEAKPKFPPFLEAQTYLQTCHPSSPTLILSFVSVLGKSFSTFMTIIYF